jgi:hypothetical protein
MCRQEEVSASGRTLVQKSPTGCRVSECDLETSKLRGHRPTRAVETLKVFIYKNAVNCVNSLPVVEFSNCFLIRKNLHGESSLLGSDRLSLSVELQTS